MAIGVYLVCWISVSLIGSIELLFGRLRIKKSMVLDNLFFTVGILVLSFFAAFNTYNADYLMYKRIYDSIGQNMSFQLRPELLFSTLCWLGNLLSLDYQAFVAAIYSVGFVSIFVFVRNHDCNKSFTLLMYFLSAYILDTVQLKQFIATAIYIHFIKYLLNEKSVMDILKYTAGTLLAALSHTSFLVLLMFLILKLERKAKIRICICIAVLSAAGVSVLDKTGLLLRIARTFLDADQVTAYFAKSGNYFNSSRLVLLYIISQPIFQMCILLFERKGVLKNKRGLEGKDEQFVVNVIAMNALLLCLIPLLFFSLQFRRIYRIIFIPTIIAHNKMVKKTSSLMKLVSGLLWIICIVISIWWSISSNTMLVNNLFEYNLLF